MKAMTINTYGTHATFTSEDVETPTLKTDKYS
ncbi:hypothetical protein J2Z57_000048 [Formosa algae]|uniref:Uncharacterized protein n=1 Tax=Formosa algae TaxID=225843 RepID=A0A9X1CB72_9FLAO|nr:hypothetical protein [Formosa algae]MDQ0333626.1 hypothetical protein [Formosa algae]